MRLVCPPKMSCRPCRHDLANYRPPPNPLSPLCASLPSAPAAQCPTTSIAAANLLLRLTKSLPGVPICGTVFHASPAQRPSLPFSPNRWWLWSPVHSWQRASFSWAERAVRTPSLCCIDCPVVLFLAQSWNPPACHHLYHDFRSPIRCRPRRMRPPAACATVTLAPSNIHLSSDMAFATDMDCDCPPTSWNSAAHCRIPSQDCPAIPINRSRADCHAHTTYNSAHSIRPALYRAANCIDCSSFPGMLCCSAQFCSPNQVCLIADRPPTRVPKRTQRAEWKRKKIREWHVSHKIKIHNCTYIGDFIFIGTGFQQ